MNASTNELVEGDIAPDFTLQDQHGNDVSLSDFRGESVIIFFYPAAMTPGCTKQACDFRDSVASLQAAGYRVLGISKDSVAKQLKFAEHDGLSYPLLSDTELSVHRLYGAYGKKKLYGKLVEGVIRSTFIVDGDGKLTTVLRNVKATGHVARIRKLVGLDA